MQLLVVSDTHGEGTRLRALLRRYAGAVHAVLHLGDHDADLLRFAEETDLPLYAVAGNCDDGALSPRERLLALNGWRIFMTHGNTYNVSAGVERMAAQARAQEAAVCLFGHTHRSALAVQNGVLLMNPGSLTEPRDNKPPSYGLLALGETVNGEICHP